MEKFYEDDYFYWLCDRVKNKKHHKLLSFLFGHDFRYKINMDENRALDGLNLRYDYIYEKGIDENDFVYISEPCNLLEMILALAIRLSLIMDEPHKKDETHKWFWIMMDNLGLKSMTDSSFDIYYVQKTIRRFLTREYRPNEQGNLFIVHDDQDVKNLEIWKQAMIFLNEYDERRSLSESFY